jgi:hypothetical protein
VGELVVVQTAGEFGFLEVGGDVFVGHFLETGLEEVDFLEMVRMVRREWGWETDFFFAPCSTTASGCLLAVLGDAVFVAVEEVGWRVGVERGCHMHGSVHQRRRHDG